jgi:hypothetical protein
MNSKRTMLWKDTMSRDKTQVMASKISSLDGNKHTLEGTHVEGRDRGKEIRL